MDEYGGASDGTSQDLGPVTVVQILIIMALSFFAGLTWLGELARSGPDIGTMIVFDPRNGPRYWQEPGILASHAPTGDRRSGTAAPGCILMPSVMAAVGGSLVIEAKQLSEQPLFQVHWSGPRTDMGNTDCGGSADLILRLAQVRALATVAGGYGRQHLRGMF
jgi:hypothetical protein